MERARASEHKFVNEITPSKRSEGYQNEGKDAMIKKLHQNQKGYTLVEVMVSALILATVIVGIMQLFIYTSILAQLAGDKITALNEAQSTMDQIRNTNFSSIATTYPSGTTFTLPSQLTGNGVITLDTTDSNLYGVTLTVTWLNKRGQGSTITLVSKVAKR